MKLRGSPASWLSLRCLLLLAWAAWLTSAATGSALAGPLRIDCGSSSASVVNGHQFEADQKFSGGEPHTIPAAIAAANGLSSVAATLRSFPPTGGCYNLTRAPGRYTVRASFAYYNYDGLQTPPAIRVDALGLVADRVLLVQLEGASGLPNETLATPGVHYSEFIAVFKAGVVTVCFSSVDGSSRPIVNSLELLPINTDAYSLTDRDPDATADALVLLVHQRYNLGGPAVDGEPVDAAYRMWGDLPNDYDIIGNHTRVRVPPGTQISGLVTADELPASLFRSAWQAAPTSPVPEPEGLQLTGFAIPFSPSNGSVPLLIRFHFCELNSSAEPGQRVFNILFGQGEFYEATSPRDVGFDILNYAARAEALSYTKLMCINTGLSPGDSVFLQVLLQGFNTSMLPPIVSGFELLEILLVNGSSPLASALSCASAPISPAPGPSPASIPSVTLPASPPPPSSAPGFPLLPLLIALVILASTLIVVL